MSLVSTAVDDDIPSNSNACLLSFGLISKGKWTIMMHRELLVKSKNIQAQILDTAKQGISYYLRLPMGIRSNYPMCVSDLNFVMGTYNIYIQ